MRENILAREAWLCSSQNSKWSVAFLPQDLTQKFIREVDRKGFR